MARSGQSGSGYAPTETEMHMLLGRFPLRGYEVCYNTRNDNKLQYTMLNSNMNYKIKVYELQIARFGHQRPLGANVELHSDDGVLYSSRRRAEKKPEAVRPHLGAVSLMLRAWSCPFAFPLSVRPRASHISQLLLDPDTTKVWVASTLNPKHKSSPNHSRTTTTMTTLFWAWRTTSTRAMLVWQLWATWQLLRPLLVQYPMTQPLWSQIQQPRCRKAD